MPPREELLAREATAWEAFDRAVDRVAPQDRERPDAVPGWSVKDLVWHCAYWADFCAATLERTGPAPFVDPFDGEDDAIWDEENARIAEASSAMTWDQVVEGAGAARVRVRAAVELGTDDEAAAFFGDETFVHYEEHTVQVATFADRLASS